jgi:RNA polymerase sigma-70 factor (ECF subfamily)
MAAAADGDRAALEPLFDALWPIAAGYAQRLLGGDRALAEDCTQDALVSLFAQLARFDRARDGLSWALTLVTWSCRTARRRRAREAARTSTPSMEPALDGHAQAVERDLVRAALAALGSLAPTDIETITAAIAGHRGDRIPPATFRKRLERSLARLRNAWRARHGST